MVGVGIPAFEPHPDVWLIVGALAALYAVALVRLGPAHAPDPRRVVTRFQVGCFSVGLAAMWLVSDWPIHDVAERQLYSIHMVQHLTLSLVVAPLLLLGTPAWLARLVLVRLRLLGTTRRFARFLPATIVFNAVVVVMHIPAVVSAGLGSSSVHFVLHTLVLTSALVVWLPLVSPLPEIPRLAPPLQMLYLLLQSLIPTIPASFLLYGSAPLYRDYERFTRLWGISVSSDETIAGLLMKTGPGIVTGIVITIIFFRWFEAEESTPGPLPRKASRDLDRELLGLQNP